MKVLLATSLVVLVLLMSNASGFTLKRDEPKSTRQLSRGVNGGSDCMACTVVVSLVEQLAIIYNQTVESALDQFCGFLPVGVFRKSCEAAVKLFGPVVINGYDLKSESF